MSTKHSADALADMLEHLMYEVEMLNTTSALLTVTGNESVLGNAAIESFLIHARILLGVFYVKDRDKDAVSAWDYIPDWSVRRQLSQETLDFFACTRLALNKHLAHLSVDRLGADPGRQKWNIARITFELQNAFNVFEQSRSLTGWA